MKTLTISGDGSMQTYSDGNQPWYTIMSKLTTITIGEEVETIGSYAFKGANGVTSIDLKNVNSIGSYAFANSGLTEVIINNHMKTLGEKVFSNCLNLRKSVPLQT